jgi:hypothetical protein
MNRESVMTAALAPSTNDEPSSISHIRTAAEMEQVPRWKGTGEVVPFPAVARRCWIANAFIDADRHHKNRPEYYRRLVERRRKELESIGVAPARIDADVAALQEVFFG